MPLTAEITDHEVILTRGDRRYRIRGLSKNMSFDQLKVNVLVSRAEGFHVDTLDLYSARHRAAYIKQAAVELGLKEEVIKKDLGAVLLKLEELQEEQIRNALEPEEKPVRLTEEERQEALELLRDARLIEVILSDFDRCGVVGEGTNKLMGYLAAVSRKLEDPLAVIIQSSSAAGKSRLMEAILSFMPEEEQVKYSAMTGQSLFYMGETDLKHKILAIVEEEGAERAGYALKLLQSERELTIASTGKDPSTGRLVTQEYRVQGPVMILLTTTAIDIDEELLSRCIVLTVDEDREQTRAIHTRQRQSQTLEGMLARRERARVLAVHRNAQRLLRPLLVANPYAHSLTFLDNKTRMRRDHIKYLTLIRAIALLHQYQREVKRVKPNGGFTGNGGVSGALEYIDVELSDIALANRLAHEVLGRTLDELAPQTRRLLMLLDTMVSECCRRHAMDRSDYRFTRREVRQYTGWSDFQVRTHLDKLVSMEYVLTHRGARGYRYVYELLYDGNGRDGRPFLMGLIEADTLESRKISGYDENNEGSNGRFEHQKGDFEGGSSPQRAPIEPHVRVGQTAREPSIHAATGGSEGKMAKNAQGAKKNHESSYVPSRRTLGASALAAKGKGQ